MNAKEIIKLYKTRIKEYKKVLKQDEVSEKGKKVVEAEIKRFESYIVGLKKIGGK